MEEKRTLMKLRRDYNERAEIPITSQRLAEVAGVALADEFLMELGRPVSAEVARRVIKTFNALTGQHYTFADIEVSLKKLRFLRDTATT